MDVGPGIDRELPRWATCTFDCEYWDNLAPSELVDEPRGRFEVDTLEAQRSDSLDEAQLYQRNLAVIRDESCESLFAYT
jgi:hypothetical protein